MKLSRLQLLASAALRAYSDLPVPQFYNYRHISIPSRFTQTVIFYNDDELIVSFRGTDQVRDARRDLRVWKVRRPGLPGKWAAGFTQALDDVRSHLLDILEDLAPRDIYITGHSLGGALAIQLTAYVMRYMHSRYRGTVTFGAPRVANKRACAWLDAACGKRILQVENDGDQICHVPPRLLNYRHPGDRLVLSSVHGAVPKRKKALNLIGLVPLPTPLQKATRKISSTRVFHRMLLYAARVRGLATAQRKSGSTASTTARLLRS